MIITRRDYTRHVLLFLDYISDLISPDLVQVRRTSRVNVPRKVSQHFAGTGSTGNPTHISDDGKLQSHTVRSLQYRYVVGSISTLQGPSWRPSLLVRHCHGAGICGNLHIDVERIRHACVHVVPLRMTEGKLLCDGFFSEHLPKWESAFRNFRYPCVLRTSAFLEFLMSLCLSHNGYCGGILDFDGYTLVR